MYSWLASKDLEVGYLEGKDEDVFNHYRVKKGVVEFLFATVIMEDPQHFIQSFQPEIISKDLFSVDNNDKLVVAQEMIKRISRDNKLEKIGYEENKVSFTEGETATINMYYKDDKVTSINLQFSKTPNHHNENAEIYSIKTSVWDIIEEIEKGTEYFFILVPFYLSTLTKLILKASTYQIF